MATELEGNVKLQRFIQLLADLNHQTVDMIKSGDTKLLYAMNKTVEEINNNAATTPDTIFFNIIYSPSFLLI